MAIAFREEVPVPSGWIIGSGGRGRSGDCRIHTSPRADARWRRKIRLATRHERSLTEALRMGRRALESVPGTRMLGDFDWYEDRSALGSSV